MKKTYRRNKRSPARSIALVAGVFLLLSAGIFFFQPISAIVRETARPVLGLGNTVSKGTASVFSSFFLGDACVRISTLESENENLRLELEKIQKENKQYDAMVDRYGKAAIDGEIIVADVLITPPQSMYDTIVIDHGEKEGVVEGAYVYAAHNLFIGSVVAVSSHTALVEIVSSPGYVAEVIINGKEPVRTRVFGRGSGNLTAVLPRDVDILEGDEVILPGFGGIRIGNVDMIETEQNDPFQQIRIRIDVNFHTLTTVAVLPLSITEFPEYVRSTDVVLDIDMEEVDRDEAIDSEDETNDDTSATSSDEASNEAEE